MLRSLTLAALLALGAPAGADASSTYTIDPNHSEVSFQIRHFVTQVRGVFNAFAATIVRDDENAAGSSVEFRIQAASIDTRHEKRDGHLRSADFFDVENHPEIVFKSTSIEKVSDQEYQVTGELSLRGVVKTLTVPVFFSGDIAGRRGATLAGFSAALTLDRKEFGIVWNQTLDNGGLVLGDEVQIQINLETRKN